jgi:hypothetical protein
MNPKYNKNSCCTIKHNTRNTNSNIKMVFSNKIITNM